MLKYSKITLCLWGPPHQIFKPSYGPKQDARKSFEGKAEKIPDGLIRPSRTPLSCEVPACLPRTTDTQWMHKSKKSENFGRCGRQNMLWLYLQIWKWELVFGHWLKVISSPAVRSPWCLLVCLPMHYLPCIPLRFNRPIPYSFFAELIKIIVN